MEKKLLIIWDSSHQMKSKEGAMAYFKDYLLNPLSLDYFKNCELDIIDTQDEFVDNYQIKKDFDFTCYKGIVIALDLKWEAFKVKYNGLALLSLIREKRYKHPVFLVSQDNKEKIYKSKNLLVNLLKTPAAYLIDAAELTIDLKGEQEPQAISEQLLDDILYYANSKVGIVEEILHRTKNRLRKIDWSTEKDEEYIGLIKDAFEAITPCYTENQIAVLNPIFDAIYSDIPKRTIKPSELFYQRKAEILSLLDIDLKDSEKVEADWHVLFADDDEHIREKVKEFFKNKGIVCHTAKDADETYSLLQKDIKGHLKNEEGHSYPANTITIVIADYRFENQLGEWDQTQGYDIIDYIHTQLHNTVSFFVLTSKKGAIVSQARRNSKIRISWHAKDDVLDSQSSFDIFFDQVFEEGEKTYEALCGKPQSTTWHKASEMIKSPLKDYYRFYRNMGNYSEIESEINRDVKTFLEEVEYEIGRVSKTSDILTPNIELDLNELNFNIEFMAQIKGSPSFDNDEDMTKFITKLKGRRIALALVSDRYNYSPEQIKNILKFGKTRPSEDDYFSVLSEKKKRQIENEGLPIPKEEKQLLTTYLNLTQRIGEQVPYNVLPEELSFLEKDCREERKKWYKINQEIEKACREIYKSDSDKYAGDKFLEKPPKVYSDKELEKFFNKTYKEYRYKIQL